MKRVLKKLSFVRIHACVYLSNDHSRYHDFHFPFEYKIFDKETKSGIRKIDKKIKKDNKCFAVFNNEELVHTSWVFKRNLLAKQLKFKNVHIVGIQPPFMETLATATILPSLAIQT